MSDDGKVLEQVKRYKAGDGSIMEILEAAGISSSKPGVFQLADKIDACSSPEEAVDKVFQFASV